MSVLVLDLVMAHRRKRIRLDQLHDFLVRLTALPIDALDLNQSEVPDLPQLALTHQLTTYDAAYISLAAAMQLPLATNDGALRRAATTLGVKIF